MPVVPRENPPLTCSSDQVGHCARCSALCHRYGLGGNPLCASCLKDAQEQWGGSVRQQAGAAA
jgi:hypothetical protein